MNREEAGVLVVDDDRSFVDAVTAYGRLLKLPVEGALSLAQARHALSRRMFRLLLLDLTLPDGSGLDLLAELDLLQGTRVVVVTGQPSVSSAIAAVRLPVFDYLLKPLAPGQLPELLQSLRSVQCEPQQALEVSEMLGASAQMREVFAQLQKVAPLDVTVLLQGESGTGKELAARAIHEHSGRSGPFLALNCGAVTAELLGSELFGHERGSFTGAARQHAGVFERAAGGTLFLDEVTEMPITLQTHLLRVLETRQVTRVGGSSELPVDVRVVAATNRHAGDAVAARVLREDLYYRLAEFSIELPPLRERGEDCVVLAQHLLDRFNRHYSLQRRFSWEALEYIRRHPWPGNVRELKHAVQRAFIMAEDDLLQFGPPATAQLRSIGTSQVPQLAIPIGMKLDEVHSHLLLETLRHFDNDKVKAARALGISLKTVYNWLARHETGSAGAPCQQAS